MSFWDTRLGRYIDNKRTERLVKEYYANAPVANITPTIRLRCPCCSHGLMTIEEDIYTCPDCGIEYQYNKVMNLAGAHCPRCNHVTWQYSERELSKCEKCTTAFLIYTDSGFRYNGPERKRKTEINQKETNPLAYCYALLECQLDASLEEVTRKYKELAKVYHPDKLVAKDIPEEIRKLTSDKFIDIKYAYEKIKDTLTKASGY